MRVAIPEKIREQLAEDPFMHRCILTALGDCDGPIEWNHAFTYAGKRQSERWAILPMCNKHHREEARFRLTIASIVRTRIDFFYAKTEFKEKYPKSTLYES